MPAFVYWSTQASSTPRDGSLACYVPETEASDYQGSFSIHADGVGGLSMRGWLVDMTPDGGNGTSPITVMFRVDSKFHIQGRADIPTVVANLPRPDIPTPSKNHGFV